MKQDETEKVKYHAISQAEAQERIAKALERIADILDETYSTDSHGNRALVVYRGDL